MVADERRSILVKCFRMHKCLVPDFEKALQQARLMVSIDLALLVSYHFYRR